VYCSVVAVPSLVRLITRSLRLSSPIRRAKNMRGSESPPLRLVSLRKSCPILVDDKGSVSGYDTATSRFDTTTFLNTGESYTFARCRVFLHRADGNCCHRPGSGTMSVVPPIVPRVVA
jgi:hypothetical protein